MSGFDIFFMLLAFSLFNISVLVVARKTPLDHTGTLNKANIKYGTKIGQETSKPEN